MAGLHKQRERTVISLRPLNGADNSFLGTFSDAISEQGYGVREFRWSSLGLRKTDFIFLHWPDELLRTKRKIGLIRSLGKLAVIQVAKMLWGTKLIWIAHNAMPHDAAKVNSLSQRWFLRLLDGVIFLSEYSRKLIFELYPEIGTRKTLLTVHGHYRRAAVTRETPCVMPSGEIQLVLFGRIRPYKNIEPLVEAVASIPSGIRLLVAGMATDSALCAAIEERSRQAANVRLDFREFPINDAELESIVDSADAVVLPYRNILNSGSALFSLSRNRPVLAPNMGALPELRFTVGQEWVYLYDGEFSQQVLVNFREWMLRTNRGCTAPLDAYEWDRIGHKLGEFIETMNA
jgi:beta-1,4-mannosyltransferase